MKKLAKQLLLVLAIIICFMTGCAGATDDYDDSATTQTTQETELTDLNVDLYLQKMEAEEKQGNKFADILDDYKKVVESESI